MRALEITRKFGVENLHVSDHPDPECGPHDVVIDVKAASLNYRDLLMVKGQYNPRQPLPLIPLSDGAGVVVEVGSAVRTVAVGDHVCGLFCQAFADGLPDKDALRSTLGGPLPGMARTRAVLHEAGVAKFPDGYSFAEAACLPCAGLTAWTGLVEEARIKPGDVVLTLGSGGVSMFAIDFAKRAGATVIVTTSSDEKSAFLKSRGADLVVNRTEEPDWEKPVRAFTGGRGVDVVVEVGGQGTLGRSIKAVRPGGTILLIGVLADGAAPNLTAVLMSHVRIQGVFVGHRRGFHDMVRALSSMEARPVIHRTFALDDAKDAFALLESGAHMGKIVLTL